MPETRVSRTAGVIFGLVLATAANELAAQRLTNADALRVDALAYAAHFGTNLEEAQRRLSVQLSLGDLEAALEREAKTVYAGLWLEHSPDFRVVIGFSDLAKGAEQLESLGWKESVLPLELRAQRYNVAELEQKLEATATQLRRLGFAADLQIDVERNQVEVLASDLDHLDLIFDQRGEVLAEGVTTRRVASLAKPQMEVRGGRLLSGCTSGFSVQSSNGQLGLATAGHCGATQTYWDEFSPLTHVAEDYEGNQDVQWHRAACGLDVRNEFDAGNGEIRTVSGSLGRSGQAVGSFVCKQGMTTGRTCGTIGSKSFCPSYVPNGKSTFICVNAGDRPLSSPGDSGGPWFVGTTAYGIHSGGGDNGGLSIYMAVDYMSSLGIQVLNYQAGVWPYGSLSCYGAYQGSTFVQCSVLERGGTPPFTYGTWLYWGSAASWGGGGDYASASWDYPGCPADDVSVFSVQITDACGRTGWVQGDVRCTPNCSPTCYFE